MGTFGNTLHQAEQRRRTRPNGAFIVITQQAVVFNLGAAFANSGFNSATGVGGTGLTDSQLAALVSLYQILNALLEAGGWALPPDPGASGGVGDAVGDATLHTGDATAIGVNAGTSITQSVQREGPGRRHQRVAGRARGERRPRRREHGRQRRGRCGHRLRRRRHQLAGDRRLSPSFLAALSGGSVVARRHRRGGRPLRLRWPDRLAHRSRGDDRSARRLDARQISSGLPKIPQARRRKHIRVRQVIGTLTFSFSSANGQDTTETVGKVVENDTETDDGRRSSAHNADQLGLRHFADQTVDGRLVVSTVRPRARLPIRARSKPT